MGMVKEYAILKDGVCVNRVLWDGVTKWQPPEGCIAVEDEQRIYSMPENTTPSDPLSMLTEEQKTLIIELLKTTLNLE